MIRLVGLRVALSRGLFLWQVWLVDVSVLHCEARGWLMSLIEGVDQAVRAAFCTVGSTVEGLSGVLGLLGDPEVGPGPGLADSYQRAREFRAQYCDGDGGEDPPVPFTGGQCPVVYLVDLTNTSTTVPTPATGQVFANGPIGGVITTPGTMPGTINVSVAANPIQGFRTGNEGENWIISGVSRLDGNPDNCGNPDPVFPTPVIPPVNVDIEVSPSLTIPATIIYAPVQIDVNGTISAPVTINLNGEFPIEISGTVEFAPNFEFNFDPSKYFPETPDEPVPNPDPLDPTDGEEPEEPEDEPEDEQPIFAVLLSASIQSDARPSGIFQSDGPDIYAPRLGSVRFGSVVGGFIFWSEDIDVKGLRSVVVNPIPWGSQTVAVNAEPGVAINFSAVRSAPREWPPFLALGTQQTRDNR